MPSIMPMLLLQSETPITTASLSQLHAGYTNAEKKDHQFTKEKKIQANPFARSCEKEVHRGT